MLENPILEDSVESANEQEKAADAPAADANGADVERVGETETPIVEIRDGKLDTTAEVRRTPTRTRPVSDFDWEGYLDNQAAAAPMPSYKSNNEDLPSLEATLTRGTSLFRPPGVAAQAEPLHAGRRRHRDADHRQPDAGRISGRFTRGSGGGGRGHAGAGRIGPQADPGVRFRSVWPRDRSRSAC
jgi:hypothetical protein